jgi:hypothetical protein
MTISVTDDTNSNTSSPIVCLDATILHVRSVTESLDASRSAPLTDGPRLVLDSMRVCRDTNGRRLNQANIQCLRGRLVMVDGTPNTDAMADKMAERHYTLGFQTNQDLPGMGTKSRVCASK